jgi:hypothetical protein
MERGFTKGGLQRIILNSGHEVEGSFK